MSTHLELLERALMSAGEARLYLRPLGINAGEAAAALRRSGQALPLAGGPLVFETALVILRRHGGRENIPVPATALAAWAERATGALEARLAELLRRLSAPRPAFSWSAGAPPWLMGIVNVTPDSFSDGGALADAAAAIVHARVLAAQGAAILDIGGESTRPGATPVPPEVEVERVRPVLGGLGAARPAGVALSIDTRRAAVMREALALGVDILNDVSALTADADSMLVAGASDAAVVLMHMPDEPARMNLAPRYDDVALDVFDFLEARIDACVRAGIDRRRLIVDPGIGFGKHGPHNVAVLEQIALYHGLGCPILLGVSRKGLSETHQKLSPRERLPASYAATMHALTQGVQILRAHDVAETAQVVHIWRHLTGIAGEG